MNVFNDKQCRCELGFNFHKMDRVFPGTCTCRFVDWKHLMQKFSHVRYMHVFGKLYLPIRYSFIIWLANTYSFPSVCLRIHFSVGMYHS